MKNGLKLFWMTALLVANCSTANAQKRTIPTDQVPEQITTYIATYFPSNALVKAVFDDHPVHKKYEISLTDKISLEFTPDYAIKEIKSKTKLPDAVIPAPILDYVKANYPSNVINDWELEDGNQLVELDSGLELEFSLVGEFLKLD